MLNIKLLALYLRNVSQVRAVRIKIIKIYFKRGVAWMNITLSPTYVRIHRFYTSNLIWRHNGLSVFFCIYLHIKAIFMADPNGFNFKNFSLRFLVRISRPHRKPEVRSWEAFSLKTMIAVLSCLLLVSRIACLACFL